MYPLLFCIRCSTKKFRIERLYECMIQFMNINKISYYKKNDEDYAIVQVKEWKHSKYIQKIINEIIYDREAIIPITNKKYWMLTPVDMDYVMRMMVINNDTKNKQMMLA